MTGRRSPESRPAGPSDRCCCHHSRLICRRTGILFVSLASPPAAPCERGASVHRPAFRLLAKPSPSLQRLVTCEPVHAFPAAYSSPRFLAADASDWQSGLSFGFEDRSFCCRCSPQACTPHDSRGRRVTGCDPSADTCKHAPLISRYVMLRLVAAGCRVITGTGSSDRRTASSLPLHSHSP